MNFNNAIVRRPCRNIVNGLTSVKLGLPDYKKAVIQHEKYINVLEDCDLTVEILNAEENFPDSVFVEDTAVLIPELAIITNPKEISRRGEVFLIKEVLLKNYSKIKEINFPGVLEAGDVLKVENHFYIGLSKRTNEEGARQLLKILNDYNYTGQIVDVNNVLHLKTGISYLGNNTILASGEFINKREFTKYNIIKVDEGEEYAANSININDRILIPKGFPKTKRKIESEGFITVEIDVSEFQKVDGGLSCLSLRF